MFKLVLEKAEGPEIRLPTSAGSWKKQESSRKNIYFCFIDYAKAFDCVDHNKLWKILREMGIPDHLTCLLRNLYAGQGATVRTGHWTTDRFQIGKGVRQGCILSPVGSCIRHYWQNGGTAPIPSPHLAGKALGRGVRPCDSDLFFSFFGWVGWKEC